jgi:hypothetical protein
MNYPALLAATQQAINLLLDDEAKATPGPLL